MKEAVDGTHLTFVFAAQSARSASRSAASAWIKLFFAAVILPSLCTPAFLCSRVEWRLGVVALVVVRSGEDERRRENMPERRVGEVVCWTAGAGEGSRRDPKSGMLWMGLGLWVVLDGLDGGRSSGLLETKSLVEVAIAVEFNLS